MPKVMVEVMGLASDPDDPTTYAEAATLTWDEDGVRIENGLPTAVETVVVPDLERKFRLLNDFEGHQKLGSGGRGMVIRVKRISDQTETALKLIPLTQGQEQGSDLASEAKKHFGINRHPGVVNCLDFWKDSFSYHEFTQFTKLVKPNKNETFASYPSNTTKLDFLCIQMELCENGNLRSWLKKRSLSLSAVKFKECVRIFVQVVRGIEHIHAHGLIHRDLKPANILLWDNQAKIGDLGYSATLAKGERCEELNAGACLYRAPEQATGSYGKAIDFYALGIILFELFCPPAQKNIGEAIGALKKTGLLPADLVIKFPDVAKLIKSLLSVDSADRPNAEEIYIEMKKWKAYSKLPPPAYKLTMNHLAFNCQNCLKILTDPRYQCSICPGCCFVICPSCRDAACDHPKDFEKSKCPHTNCNNW